MDYTEVIKTILYTNKELNINNLLYVIKDCNHKLIGVTMDNSETALIITQLKKEQDSTGSPRQEEAHEIIKYFIGCTLHLLKDEEEELLKISIINKTKFKEITLNENLINYGYRKKDEQALLNFYTNNKDYLLKLRDYKDIYTNYNGVLIDLKENTIIKPSLINPVESCIKYFNINNKLVDIDNILNEFNIKYTLHLT